MTLTDYFLYTIWALFPAFYFISIIYVKLERLSGRTTRDDLGDFFRQGFFTLLCVIVSILVDRYILKDLIQGTIGDLIPLGFFRIILFPVVLIGLGKVIGPSKTIRVSQVTRVGDLPSQKRQRQKKNQRNKR